VTSGSDHGSGSREPQLHDEVVQFGSQRRSTRGRLSQLLIAGLVIAAIVLVLYHPGKHPGTRPQPKAQPPVSITSVGHPILGVTASWELSGLTTSYTVVSVRFDRGQITRTVLPHAEGNGPVSLIVGPHEVIVRPLDNVPGYVVPDGQPARQLTGILAHGGLLLPGPVPADEWLVSGGAEPVTLVGPAGQATRGYLAGAAQHWQAQTAMADGRGEVLLLNGAGVLYDTGPNLMRRVGVQLAAVGPRTWLGLSCPHAHCHNVVVNAATGARRTLPGPAVDIVGWPWPAEPGVVAPDGSLAAVAVAYGGSGIALDLVNLRSGVATMIGVPIAQDSSSRTLAWSPDSRWLFVITASGQLVAVSARDGGVHSLGILLPGLSQIAMRGAGS
jgi:hypothetical protein